MRLLPMCCLGATLVLAACGGGGSGDDALRVAAAASLRTALGESRSAPPASLSFAGSDELAAQIRQGGRPDVFAAANAKLPDALFAEGLVERPVAFATNRVVLAVPADGPAVRDLAGLLARRPAFAIGAKGVPIGDATRKLLAGLAPRHRRTVHGLVRSEEPDVAGVVGKLLQGAVDAGFVYATDVAATDGRLRTLPTGGPRVEVVYKAAVVKGTAQLEAARAYVRGLRDGAGQAALRASGFAPPP